MNTKDRWHALLLTSVFFAVVGCDGSNEKKGREQQTSHLRSLISLYNFAGSRLGHPPANEEQFTAFIEQSAGPFLQRLQLASAEELFVSERDGQPFVVVYGTSAPGVSNDVVAYERIGLHGKRQVGFKLGMIEEVDESRFRELVPASVGEP